MTKEEWMEKRDALTDEIVRLRARVEELEGALRISAAVQTRLIEERRELRERLHDMEPTL